MMKGSDNIFEVMEWHKRLNRLYNDPEEVEVNRGKTAFVFFIAGLLTGIIIMQYIIPLIQIYL